MTLQVSIARHVHSYRVARWLALAFTLASCSPKPGEAAATDAVRQAPLEVTVTRAQPGEIQRSVIATGTLFGEEQAMIAAKVAGRVEAVLHDIGDVLEPDAVLARIEARDYELARTERERAFEQALTGLGLERLPDGEFSPERLPSVERARLRVANAKQRFERAQLLHGRTPQTVSDQEFADISSAYDVAQAELRIAQLDAQTQLAQARTLEAQLATARQRLADATIRAPSGLLPREDTEPEGVSHRYAVSARRVSVGDYVTVGAPMFELVDSDPLELRVRLPERCVAQIAVGQEALFEVEAYAERFRGRVARISPAVDVRTRTFEARIVVPNSDGRLRAGSFAKAEILTARDANALLVPMSSVVTFAGVNKLFLLADGRVAERVVELGQRDGERVEIVRGLAVGDRFVTAPPPALVSGDEVRATELQP